MPLRHVGQTFSGLGLHDPRIDARGKQDRRLTTMYRAHKKADPAPNRVKPVPTEILQFFIQQTNRNPSPLNTVIADMLVLAFFFLLRPGEYTSAESTSHPFLLRDVAFRVGFRYINPLTASLEDIRSATFVTLTFSTQKNAVRGEVVGLGRSGDPYLCPVRAVIRRVVHLRQNFASHKTPLSAYFLHNAQHPKHLPSAVLTLALRQAATLLGPRLGFKPLDISARSLRAGGATALLCANVSGDFIKLLGRWRSDEMLRYLHLQAYQRMKDIAPAMVQSGAFEFLQGPNPNAPDTTPGGD